MPLALHVDYWDYIGWKDPYAKREFSLRQRKLSQLQRMALVYTPQVVLQGRDFRGWGTKGFDEAVARINAQPARANLKLELLRADANGLDVEVKCGAGEAGLTIRLSTWPPTRAGCESRVTAGENRGRILTHDYVVLEWQGPFAFAEPPGGAPHAALAAGRGRGELRGGSLRAKPAHRGGAAGPSAPR